jgi:hypothetical protein
MEISPKKGWAGPF